MQDGFEDTPLPKEISAEVAVTIFCLGLAGILGLIVLIGDAIWG